MVLLCTMPTGLGKDYFAVNCPQHLSVCMNPEVTCTILAAFALKISLCSAGVRVAVLPSLMTVS